MNISCTKVIEKIRGSTFPMASVLYLKLFVSIIFAVGIDIGDPLMTRLSIITIILIGLLYFCTKCILFYVAFFNNDIVWFYFDDPVNKEHNPPKIFEMIRFEYESKIEAKRTLIQLICLIIAILCLLTSLLLESC